MTLPRTQASYGGLKADARPFSNPKTDARAGDWNRAMADLAALTSAAPVKLAAIFNTATSNGAIVPSSFWAQWGLGSVNQPVITRTAAGVYTVTTPSAWVTPGTWVYTLDPNGVQQTNEQVVWNWCLPKIHATVGAAAGQIRESFSGYTITLTITGPPVLIAVTGAANNGSGLIRLTTASAHGRTTNDLIAVSGVLGTTEANASSWPVTVVDSTHLDLQGSSFVNAYTSGGMTWFSPPSDLGGNVALSFVAG